MTERLVEISEALTRRVDDMTFQEPVERVYNPLVYAKSLHDGYLTTFGSVTPREILLVGMNPGPWGMGQTGVPFGDVDFVSEWMGLDADVAKPDDEHPKRPVEGLACDRNEVSGSRLWGWARDRYGDAEHFFERYFVHNYCPLLFLEESGRNRTPNKLKADERRALFPHCDEALRDIVAGPASQQYRGRRGRVCDDAESGPRSKPVTDRGADDRPHPPPQPGQPPGQQGLGAAGRRTNSSRRRHRSCKSQWTTEIGRARGIATSNHGRTMASRRDAPRGRGRVDIDADTVTQMARSTLDGRRQNPRNDDGVVIKSSARAYVTAGVRLHQKHRPDSVRVRWTGNGVRYVARPIECSARSWVTMSGFESRESTATRRTERDASLDIETDIRVAQTGEPDTQSTAVSALLDELDATSAALTFIFHSPTHDPATIAGCLDEVTGAHGLAGTTAGELGADGFENDSITGIALHGPGVRASVEIVPHLRELSLLPLMNVPSQMARRPRPRDVPTESRPTCLAGPRRRALVQRRPVDAVFHAG